MTQSGRVAGPAGTVLRRKVRVGGPPTGDMLLTLQRVALVMPDEDDGTWVDVAPLHEPEPRQGRRRKGGFGHNVGLEGYERGTGGEVIRAPRFKRPGDKKPAESDPFSD